MKTFRVVFLDRANGIVETYNVRSETPPDGWARRCCERGWVYNRPDVVQAEITGYTMEQVDRQGRQK